MTSLEGKVIAITGAASGIGRATAILLASRGASVSLADIQEERLQQTTTEIQKLNPNSRVYSRVVDISKSGEVDTWLDGTIKDLGQLNGAANVAGGAGIASGVLPKTIRETDDSQWDHLLEVNLKGTFNCVRAELQRMDRGASIVNMASVAGLRGYPTGVAYCASKHGVIGITQTAAREEGSNNIRVNCIAPGPIDTPMLKDFDANAPHLSSIELMLCIQRRGSPEEVAKLIAFLLSDESSYTTGACYTIDGGLTA